MFEKCPVLTRKFLDTPEAAKLPVEARVLASLALEPKASASRVAKLLPQLDRAPNDEELLRLAQFPEEVGCGDALKALLSNAKSRAVVADKLLTQKTKLDASKIAPLLSEAGKALLGGKDDERALSVSLIGGFQLASLEKELVALVAPTHDTIIEKGQNRSGFTTVATGTYAVSVLQALRELRSGATEVFADLAKSTDPMIRDEALAALAASKNPNAAEQLFTLYPSLTSAQQRSALSALSASKPGAKAIVAALASKRIPTTDLDGPTAERLSLVLGNDAELTKLMASLGHVFHDVLAFDGSDDAWVDSKITLDGPFTVETWVRLNEGIGNEDDILGVPGGVEMNFFGSTFRVFAGPKLHDVAVAKKPMTPDLWTHIAVTRDAKGMIKIYQNGELDAVSKVPAPDKWENCRIGWSGPKRGTQGMMAEFRVWKTERTAAEIRGSFDRTFDSKASYSAYPNPESKLSKGARLAKTTDYPPILTPEQAEALDKKFTKLTALGHKKGDLTKGKALSALCLACHQIGATGGQIGPNLSGAGAMGLEGVLRNILTPNAAMEPGYRIFRAEMKSGDIVDAFYVNEDKQAYVIRQPGLQDRRLPKQDVRSTRYIRRSLMPEGLLDALNDEQVTDLLSYLMTLK
jgi:putative heme-binding domain-containing protein